MSLSPGLREFVESSPLPSCAIDRDARFLAANDEFCELIGVPNTELCAHSVAEYCSDGSAMNTALATDGTAVVEVVLTLPNARHVRLACRAGKIPPDHLIGVVADDAYMSLVDSYVPTGVYRTDAARVIVRANHAFARMLGFTDAAQISGRCIDRLFVDPEAADQFHDRVDHAGLVSHKEVFFRRVDGTPTEVVLTAVALRDSAGAAAGYGGVVETRDAEKAYKQVLESIPVGFYVVTHVDGRDVITDCNQQFALIHEIDSREEMIGKDARAFHYSQEDTRRFTEHLKAAARGGTAVLGEQLRIRTAKGNVRTIEVNARPRVTDGVILGRTGAVRDITAEMEVRDAVNALRTDMSAFLHTFRQTVQQLKHSIAAVADVLAGEPHVRLLLPSPEELAEIVRPAIAELRAALPPLLMAAKSAAHVTAISDADVERLAYLLRMLETSEKTVPPAHWRDLWQRAALEIASMCRRIPTHTIARATYRPVLTAANRITTTTGLATLAVARDALEAVDSPLDALRELVTSGARPEEAREHCALERCVMDAIAHVTAFAEERRVELHFSGGAGRTIVDVARHAVTRALANVLHNAIKYSWQREAGGARVVVRVLRTPANAIASVENWGVPVPADEMALVFKLGFRGRLSTDRGRMGTGVGLADTLAVARAHGGSVRVESRPGATATNPADYHQPFVTTVSFEIPRLQLHTPVEG